MFPLDRAKKIVKELEDNDQIVFKYVDPEGNLAGYPWCPNGSTDNIAGICNREGNVFGLMPHPERASEALLGNDAGARIFRSFAATLLGLKSA